MIEYLFKKATYEKEENYNNHRKTNYIIDKQNYY